LHLLTPLTPQTDTSVILLDMSLEWKLLRIKALGPRRLNRDIAPGRVAAIISD